MIQEETKRNEISLTGYSTDTKLRYIASQVLQTVFDNSRFSSVGVQENEINDLMGARDYFSFFLFSFNKANALQLKIHITDTKKHTIYNAVLTRW